MRKALLATCLGLAGLFCTAAAGFAAEFDVEVIEKLLIGTVSGWLQRLVRPLAWLV